MRMKKYMILFAVVLLAACNGKEIMPDTKEVDQTQQQSLTFTADALVTKTALGADWSVSWTEGDRVKILWNGGETNCQARIEGGKAYFTAVVDEVKEYIITNDDVDRAARDILAIITAEKLKASKNICTAKELE